MAKPLTIMSALEMFWEAPNTRVNVEAAKRGHVTNGLPPCPLAPLP
jgi:hypothetical protein